MLKFHENYIFHAKIHFFFQNIENFQIWPKINQIYFHQFLSYKCDQVVKRHLFDHTNPSVRIICARAHLRARCAPRKIYHLWKIRFFEFYGSYWRARSARGSARAPKKILYLNSAHQNEQKKALAFFHIFKIERAGAAWIFFHSEKIMGFVRNYSISQRYLAKPMIFSEWKIFKPLQLFQF